MSMTQALRRLRQGNYKFQANHPGLQSEFVASLSYIVCLKQQQKQGTVTMQKLPPLAKKIKMKRKKVSLSSLSQT